MDHPDLTNQDESPDDRAERKIVEALEEWTAAQEGYEGPLVVPHFAAFFLAQHPMTNVTTSFYLTADATDGWHAIGLAEHGIGILKQHINFNPEA